MSEAVEQSAQQPGRPPAHRPVRRRARVGRRRRRALLRTLSVALVVAAMSSLLAWPVRVIGVSMEPLLHEDELILVDRLGCWLGDIRRHDVVLLDGPDGRLWAKRIIGLPGDDVTILAGMVMVNGAPLAGGNARPGSAKEMRAPVVLGPGQYYVLGDNRRASLDSRQFGPVRREDIVGRASFRCWPPLAFGPLPRGRASEDETASGAAGR